MLKAELHTHINVDPKDQRWISYSARELVDEAIRRGFQVLAITCHNLVYQNPELKEYAREKGMVLIFGVEKDVEQKHVLIYNVTPEDVENVNTFADLRRLRKEREVFTIAAHPSYWGPSCLRERIYQEPDLFDAWEHSFLHMNGYNTNRKMMERAEEYGKPVVGNSDVHLLTDLGRTYTLIDAKMDESAIFQAIKRGKIKLVTTPLSLGEFLRITIRA